MWVVGAWVCVRCPKRRARCCACPLHLLLCCCPAALLLACCWAPPGRRTAPPAPLPASPMIACLFINARAGTAHSHSDAPLHPALVQSAGGPCFAMAMPEDRPEVAPAPPPTLMRCLPLPPTATLPCAHCTAGGATDHGGTRGPPRGGGAGPPDWHSRRPGHKGKLRVGRALGCGLKSDRADPPVRGGVWQPTPLSPWVPPHPPSLLPHPPTRPPLPPSFSQSTGDRIKSVLAAGGSARREVEMELDWKESIAHPDDR